MESHGMRGSLQGARGPMSSFTQTETPDPMPVKLLKILVKQVLVWDTGVDPSQNFRLPKQRSRVVFAGCMSPSSSLVNCPCSIVQFPVTNTLTDKEMMSCSDAILYWLGVVFCVWLLWLPVKSLETMPQLFYEVSHRETGPKKYLWTILLNWLIRLAIACCSSFICSLAMTETIADMWS